MGLECYTCYMKKIHPLLAFYAIISLFTFSIAYYYNIDDSMVLMNYFMGLSFFGLGLFKCFSYKKFVESFRTYDIIGKRIALYAYAYPVIELFLGFWFIYIGDNITIDLITLFILSVNLISTTRVLLRKEKIPCACLGAKLLLPFDTWLLLENILMIAMIIYMLYGMLTMQSMGNMESMAM